MSLEFYYVLVIEQIAIAATWMCLISSVLEVGCRLVLVSGTCNVSRVILALNYFITLTKADQRFDICSH